MKVNIWGYLIVILGVILAVKYFRESDYFNLKCIISDVDGKKYCVRERGKLEMAADLLAETTVKMKKLVKWLYVYLLENFMEYSGEVPHYFVCKFLLSLSLSRLLFTT